MAKKTKADAKDAAAAEGGKTKKGKKKLLIVLLPVLLIGAFGYKTMTKKTPVASATAKSGPTTTAAGPILEESSLTVNLRDSHYLEFTAALQVAAGKTYAALSTGQPIVLDILNAQAENFTEAQLLLPNGVAQLKSDIMQALGKDWPGLVVNVFFEQFVMQ